MRNTLNRKTSALTLLIGAALSSPAAAGDGETWINDDPIKTEYFGEDGKSVYGNNNSLTNNSTIETGGDEANGMYAQGNENTLTNNGEITTTGEWANGIQASDGDDNTINNTGTISVSGEGADGIVFEDTPPGLKEGGTTDGVNKVFNSAGAKVESQLGLAIRGGDSDDIVENAGALISGVGTAVDLGEGNDSLIMYSTATVSGSLDGGAGDGDGDTLTFDGYAHTGGSDLLQWETLSLENGGSLTLDSDLIMGDGGSGDGRVDIDATSQLISSGDRVLDGSLSNGGVVSMQNGQVGDLLTVTGDYVGDGGTVVLDSALGDDTSPSDLLHIEGDTSGDSFLKVNNVGGAGAQTTSDGILVIQVDGDSQGQFTLAGDYEIEGQQAVVAGLYGYTLWQNGITNPEDGDWYLRSELLDGETIIVEPGIPLYEVYPQVLLALNGLPTLRQRIGNRYWAERGCLDPRLGGYAGLKYCAPRNVIWGRVERTYSHIQTGNADQRIDFVPADSADGTQTPIGSTGASYSTDLWKMQAGLDGLFYESDAGRLIGGITINYGTVKSDINSFYGTGRINAAGYGLGATLTWDGNNGLYLDAQGQLNWFDSDIYSETLGRNMVDGNNGFGYAAGLEIGKRLELDEHWTVTPQAQLIYSAVKFDSFTDPFGTTVSGVDGESLKGRLGVSLNYQNTWKGDDDRIAHSDVYGIANLYNEFLDGTQVYASDGVSDASFTSRNQGLSGSLGVGGSYSWGDDKYAIHGELSVNSSLPNLGESYAVGGTLGLTVKF